jgi:Phage portal protein
MGFIAQLAKKDNPIGVPTSRQSRQAWSQVFGTTKERGGSGLDLAETTLPYREMSGATGLVSEPIAIKKLIQAFRSRAPGGWSDDRWTETSKWTDVRYLVGHKLAEQIMMSELAVYIKDRSHPDGKRPVTPDDPPHGQKREALDIKPYDLVRLLEHPNWEDSFGDLMYDYVQQIVLTGMWLLWQVPNQFGTPWELYTVPTAVAIPQPVVNPGYPHGYYRIQPLYPYGPFSSFPAPTTAVGAAIPAQWVMRTKYHHPFLRYEGFSPQTGMRRTFDQIEQIDTAQWYAMKRVVGTDAVLNFDGIEGMQPLPEPEIERIHREWENEQMGAENFGKLIVGTPGGKLEKWPNNLRDLQYMEGWDQKISFAMAALGMSKEAAGMIGSTAYAVLYAAIKQMHLLTALPMCTKVAWALTRQIAPHFGDNLIIEIKPKRMDDPEINKAIADTLASTKSGTKNEVRKLMDLPVTMEPWGEDIAGDPSPLEKQQQKEQMEMNQQSAANSNNNGFGGGGNNKEPGQNGKHESKPEEGGSEKATEAMRPRPGNVGRGSKGPEMKHLNGKFRISELING